MIQDRNGIEYPDIFTALKTVRDYHKHYHQTSPLPSDADWLIADMDAIIASASGARAAAGLPAEEVRARVFGELVA